MSVELTGVFGERPVDRVIARRLVLAACTFGTLLDYGVAIVTATPIATALSIPLSLVATIGIAYAYGMWAGLAAATAVGLAGILLPDPAIGLPLLGLEVLLGGLVGRVCDLRVQVRLAREEIARSESRQRAFERRASDVVMVFDRERRATYVGASTTPLLGRPPDALMTFGYYAAFSDAAIKRIDAALANLAPGSDVRLEIEARHADGAPLALEASIRNCTDDPAVAGFVLNARDVTERRDAETRLREATTRDALTGLANRAEALARLDAAIAREGTDGHAAVLFMDLDRFKDVNDVLGHGAGDVLLQEVAHRLAATLPDAEAIARVGDDEFAIVLACTRDVVQARELAELVRASIVAPYEVAGRRIVIGASIGVATAAPGLDATKLLRHADVAMYSAKRRHDGVSIFSKLQDERALRRLTMASALHTAIANDELVLHFQPQVDLRTGRLRGAEALVRWEHPERGILYPDFFLPIAEEIGEMDRLTDWILKAAIKHVRRWNRAGHSIRVAVNLSAHDLRDDRLAESIPRLLAAYGVSAQSLCLEITETTVMTEAESAAHCLRSLSSLGVRISIDDFGTGYSAIAHLKQFPVDEIKIDKQFVLNMDHDAEDAAIVASTIDLAHRLGIDVVVEGVERTSTYEAVRNLGAEFAQGYAIGRPLSPTAFGTWMGERRGLSERTTSTA